MADKTVEPPDTSGQEAPGFFGFPARVMPAEERAKAASSDAELLALAQSHASDPSVFDEFPPAFFSAAVSTNSLDSYFTRMHRSSLQNFAGDLNTGVSLQDSHVTRERGLGYSLRGRYVGAGGNGQQRTVGDFYSVPSDPRKQAFVNDLRAGTVRDVSVGFYLGEEGRYVCDMCGNDVMSRSCSHYPGMLYPETEAAGAKMVRATATIHGARLSEVSAVYDGATPGAVILKAQRAAEEGVLLPETARLLEVQYRIALPAAHHTWRGIDFPSIEAGVAAAAEPRAINTALPLTTSSGTASVTFNTPVTARQAPKERKEIPMPEPDTRAPESAEWTLPAPERDQYRAQCSEAGLKPDLLPAAALSSLRQQLASRDAELADLKAESERTAPLADVGRQYKADLIEEVITEGVRAYGNAYPAETERHLLAGADLDQIKAKRDFHRALVPFTAGRVTTDPDSSQQTRPEPQPATPNAAYRA